MIRRHHLGFRKIPLRFAAATLFVVGCSATAQDPTASNGGSGPVPTGGTGNDGQGGSLPIAGALPPPVFAGSGNTPTGGTGGSGNGSAGKPSTAGSTAGGAPSVAGSTSLAGSGIIGGAATTAGAPGGAGAASCDTYSGTAKTDSEIFTSGYGKSTTGDWQGYAYTYSFGTGVVVTPGSSTTMSCFPGKQMCSAGSIPASDGAGAGIGWSISQMMGSSTTGTVAITTPVVFKIKAATAGMRVGLLPPGSSAKEFCYTLTATDVTAAAGATGLKVALADFKSECYDAAKATAYAGEMIQAIQVSVPGSASAAKTFDYCLIDIEPG